MHEDLSRKGAYPVLGLAWTPADGEVWRLAYQKWLRRWPFHAEPVATAGIVLDDQAVLPGGELKRLRFQFEREFSAATFARLFLDAKNVSNLGEPGNVLNQGAATTDLDRLRNRASLVFQINARRWSSAPCSSRDASPPAEPA